ncbi:MAG: hypothetical protein KIT22_08880 [Verrucomicrobiae bacterium]|nr:hypothetical protein [Verrucomicrobiae bacterium]
MNYQNRVQRQTSRLAPIIQVLDLGTKVRPPRDLTRQAWNTIARIVWRTLPDSRAEALELVGALCAIMPEEHRARRQFNDLENALIHANLNACLWSRQRGTPRPDRPHWDVVAYHLINRVTDKAAFCKAVQAIEVIIGGPEAAQRKPSSGTSLRWLQN